jgi:hypothetical protein
MNSHDVTPSPDAFDFDTSKPAVPTASPEPPPAPASAMPARAVGLIEQTATGVQRLQTLLEPPKSGASKVNRLVELLEQIVERQDQLAAKLEAIDAKLTKSSSADAVH